MLTWWKEETKHRKSTLKATKTTTAKCVCAIYWFFCLFAYTSPLNIQVVHHSIHKFASLQLQLKFYGKTNWIFFQLRVILNKLNLWMINANARNSLSISSVCICIDECWCYWSTAVQMQTHIRGTVNELNISIYSIACLSFRVTARHFQYFMRLNCTR